MDKNEYKIKLSEIMDLVDNENYVQACEIVKTIDWRRVKSVKTLSMVADVYEANKEFDESKKILMLALDRSPIGKAILYRLVEVCVKTGDTISAADYYAKFVEAAPNDNSRYILKYKLLKAKHAPVQEQIEILQEYKEREYTERWAYELAKLYSRAGMEDKCIEECDDIILWFSEGKYVIKAMELKQKYAPLTPAQRQTLENSGNSRINVSAPKVEPTFEQNLEKLHQAGAAVTDSKIRDISREAAVTLDNVSSTSVLPPNVENLQAKLAKSIRNVFAGGEEEAAEEVQENAEISDDVSDLLAGMSEDTTESEAEYDVVKDLEPETFDNAVVKRSMSQKPQQEFTAVKDNKGQKTIEKPVAGTQTAYDQVDGQLDLEALLTETANSLASEVATGDYEQTALLDEEKKIAREKEAARLATQREEAEKEAARVALEKDNQAQDLGLTREFNFDKELKALRAKEEQEKAQKEQKRILKEATEASLGLSAAIGAAEIALKTTIEPKKTVDESENKSQEEVFKLPPEVLAEIEAKKSKKVIDVPVMTAPIIDDFKIVPKEERTIKSEAEAESAKDTETIEAVPESVEAEIAEQNVEAAEAEIPAENVEAAEAETPVENVEAAEAETPAENVEAAEAETPVENVETVEVNAVEEVQDIGAPIAADSKMILESGVGIGLEAALENVLAEVTNSKPNTKEVVDEESEIVPDSGIEDMAITEETPEISETEETPGTLEKEAVSGQVFTPDSGTIDIAEAIEKEIAGHKERTQTTSYDETVDDILKGLSMVNEGGVAANIKNETTMGNQPDVSEEMAEDSSVIDGNKEENTGEAAKEEFYEEKNLEPQDVMISLEDKIVEQAEAGLNQERESTVTEQAGSTQEIVNPRTLKEEAKAAAQQEIEVQPRKLTADEKRLFTYFAAVPGMDVQLTTTLGMMKRGACSKTSKSGNVIIMGRHGSGKTRLSDALVFAACSEFEMEAAKMAHIDASDMNSQDPAKILAKMAGGFLIIERASYMSENTISALSKAMEFRTDSLKIILEDEKTNMRKMLGQYPQFADKFDSVITIPVFTNDELVTFAKTYAKEEGYKIDEMGVLALYTLIGDNQNELEPITIGKVKEMVDEAIKKAGKGTRKLGRKFSKRQTDDEERVLLYEKDFDF